VELAILGWALTFAVITAGAFLVARSIVQIASVAYNLLEKRLDHRAATRQTLLLTAGGVAALGATAVVAALAILLVLASVLEGRTF
jgi:hypothetical protein